MSNLKVDSISTDINQNPVDSVSQRKEKDELPEIIGGNIADSSYETDTDRNKFLKDYYIARAEESGISIPKGMKISISSYKFDTDIREVLRGIQNEKFWTDAKNWAKGFVMDTEKEKSIAEYCDIRGLSAEDKKKVLDMFRFTDVRVNIFGARMGDMFRLLSLDKAALQKKVDNMKISDEDKTKIMNTKEIFDNFYKVKAEIDGKTYDLANLTQDDIKSLEAISPEFAEFAKKEQKNLRKQTTNFARKELQYEEQNEAGSDSRTAAGALTVAIGATLLYSAVQTGIYMKTMKDSKALMNFLKTQPDKGQALLNKYAEEMEKRTERFGDKKGGKLFERYMKNQGFKGGEEFVKIWSTYKEGPVKWVNPIKAFKNAKGLALLGLIGTTLIGSWDDCMGAGKDFVQDQNNFGPATASTIGAAAVTGGIATSAIIAPTIEAKKDYAVAKRTLVKNGFVEKVKKPSIGAEVKALQNKNVINILKVLGKRAWPLVPAALFGMAVTSSSSGSSWTSMIGTGIKFKMNGDELESKGIISKEENTIANTIDNFYGENGYDAYTGKKDGITFGSNDNWHMGDWTLGVVGGTTGAFISPRPYIQGPLFALQGSSETLSANIYQLVFGPQVNSDKLEQAKQDLVKEAKNEKTKENKANI